MCTVHVHPTPPRTTPTYLRQKIVIFGQQELFKFKKIPPKLYRFSLLVVVFLGKTRSDEKVNYCTLHHAKNNAQYLARSKIFIEMGRGLCYFIK